MKNMMKTIKWFSAGVLVVGACVSCSVANEQAASIDADGWRPLFNGKNLEGWRAKFVGQRIDNNLLDTFRVIDGKLVVDYENWENFNGRFGHLFYNEAFSHYILRAEYRFIGQQIKTEKPYHWAKRNNGLMIHSQAPETMTVDQKFPVSIEVQLLGGLGSEARTTANICTPDTHVVIQEKLVTKHCINSSSKTFHGDQWVTVEVEVHGSEKIIHRVNGDVVFEYAQPQYDQKKAKSFIAKSGSPDLNKGYIAIQAETAPIEFRKIEIKPL